MAFAFVLVMSVLGYNFWYEAWAENWHSNTVWRERLWIPYSQCRWGWRSWACNMPSS